jgi:hypothetical protein
MIPEKRTPLASILVAWVLVCIPAAWGIYNTTLNARKLFVKTNLQSTPASPTPLPGTPNRQSAKERTLR